MANMANKAYERVKKAIIVMQYQRKEY